MEDDLQKNGRRPKTWRRPQKMKTTSKKIKNEEDLKKYKKWRRPQKNCNEYDLKKIEDDLQIR